MSRSPRLPRVLLVPLVVVPLLAAALLSACTPPLPLAAVQSPPAVDDRLRPLGEYDDRLLDALASVVGKPDLPSSQRVVVVTSPKVELMFLVAGLASGWNLMSSGTPAATSLRQSAIDHFGDLRRHDAVRHLSQIRKAGFWYDALPRLALTFSDPPAIEQVYPICDYMSARSRPCGGEAALRDFMTRLRAFAAAGDWDSWWRKHEAEYARIEEHCRMIYAALDPLGQLEDYFGERLEALVIIPSAMIACGFGGVIDDPLGAWAINCFGPATLKALPEPGFLEMMVLHEGGHAFVNHHAREHPDLVRAYAHLFSPISSEMQRQAYGNWETALNEHVLRACHARLYLLHKGEAAAAQMLSTDEARGFRYVRVLYDKLAEYEADRGRYPDFASFYPELLTVLGGF